MKYTFFLILFTALISCKKPSKLELKLNCSSSKNYEYNKTKDFNNNFTVNIPKHWKTNYYYNINTSEIYAADTLKELTKSFIIGISFHKGNIELNNDYNKKLDSLLFLKKLNKYAFGKESFLNKPAYWYLVNGTKDGYTYHQLNITIKNSDKSYINATSEIYGDQLINDRICKSISILKTIQFLQ
jgi:hypothetical protein